MLAVALLLLAFVTSGFTTLVYQILWTRVVSTSFGVTAHAIATILAAFMAGLALGSLVGGRLVGRVSGSRMGPFAAYAGVEVLVAITALGVQDFLASSGPLMGWIAETFPGTGPLALGVRFAALFAVLLVPVTLMGATLPLFVQGLVGIARSPHRAITVAYGVNVLGAAAGCYAAAFVLLEGLGVERSIALSAGLNLAAGALALLGGWLARPRDATLPAEAGEKEEELPISLPLLYTLVAGTGTTVLAFEVLWGRVYRQAFQLGNPFKGFALVLAVILVGMAIGSLLLAIRRPSARGALGLYGGFQLALAVSSLAGISQVRIGVLDRIVAPGPAQLPLLALTLLVPAMLAGACFPTLGSAYARLRDHAGARLGRLSFASTAGGVCGSLLGGFVLLPTLGVRRSVLLLAMGAVTLGWVALRKGVWRNAADSPGARRADAAGFASLVAIAWVGFVTADKPDFRLPPGQDLVWMDDGVEATTVVTWSTRSREHVLYTNSISIMARDQAARVALPMMIAPDADRVLLVGFGTGASVKALLDAFPNIQLDCVELDGNQIASASYFGTDTALRDPRFRLIVDDGRQFLLRNAGTWDLIIVDAFGQDVNQEFYGTGFYEAARDALTPNGSFFIKLPLASMGLYQDAEVMLRSLHAAFPHAWAALVNPTSGMNGLVGRREPMTLDPTRWRSMPPELQSLFAWEDIERGFVPVDDRVIARMHTNRLNTDDRPWFFDHVGGPDQEAAGWNQLGRLTARPQD